MKKVNSLKPKVFFNASVILAGLRSPGGGSGKIIGWVKNGKIDGVISEVIVDEVIRRCSKIGSKEFRTDKTLQRCLLQRPGIYE